jgi:hypothetical protein
LVARVFVETPYTGQNLKTYSLQNIGCEVTVVCEPPEDGLVKAETYVGLKNKEYEVTI